MNVEATRVHTVYPAVAIFHRIRRARAGLIDQKPDVLLGYSNQARIGGLAVGVGFSRGGFGVSPITGKFSLSRLLMEGRPAISSLWGLIDFPPRPSLPTAVLNRCAANICKYP